MWIIDIFAEIQYTMSNIRKYAENEFEILKKSNPDALIIEFEKEILDICDAFSESGQSGGSAPYTASAISSAIKKLLLFEPLTKITGDDSEWLLSPLSDPNEPTYQNSRCFGLFKDSDGKPTYSSAIVWKGAGAYDTFTGHVYIDDIKFQRISSSQYAKFPFTPKTFYIDVMYIPITPEEAEKLDINYTQGNSGSYFTIIKDINQLKEVFNYYDMRLI